MARSHRLFLLLDRAAHAVRQRLEKRAQAELGISMVQVGALFFLVEHEGSLHRELASALGIQPAGVSGLVDRMEAGGLVLRKTSSVDARAQHIHVTAAGRRIAAKAAPVVRDMQAALTEGFTPAELDIVARFLVAAADRDLPKGPS